MGTVQSPAEFFKETPEEKKFRKLEEHIKALEARIEALENRTAYLVTVGNIFR